MSETPYYAKDGKVWKRSVETKHDDGSSSFTLEFPICEATELVGEDGAVSIAGLMNLGDEAQGRPAADALVTALEFIEDHLGFHEGSEEKQTETGEPVVWINATPPDGDLQTMLRTARTALAKHKETTG